MNHHLNVCSYCIAEAPRITAHPREQKDAVPGKSVTLTIQATGTEPLIYEWQWIPAGDGKEEWRHCDVDSSDRASLKIPRVQKTNEGIYRCIISNRAGRSTSKSTKLSIGKNPDINHSCMNHPSQLCSAFCFNLQLILPKLPFIQKG